MRLFTVFACSLLPVVGCEPTAVPLPPTDQARTAIEDERERAPESAHQCDYDPDPMLAILPDRALLDGVPVDEAGFRSLLQKKRNLRVAITRRMTPELWVQVVGVVPEERVERFVTVARGAGFIDVRRSPSDVNAVR